MKRPELPTLRHELAKGTARGVYRARCGVRVRAGDYRHGWIEGGRQLGPKLEHLPACVVCLELGDVERAAAAAAIWARVDAGEGRSYREKPGGGLELVDADSTPVDDSPAAMLHRG